MAARQHHAPTRKAASAAQTPAFVPPNVDWEVAEEWEQHGRKLSSGTEVSVAGERGRFSFRRHVRRPNGTEWIDVYGGPKGSETYRSFRPDRVHAV